MYLVYCVILIIKTASCLGQHYVFRSHSALANLMCSAENVQFSTTSANDISCARVCSVNPNCTAAIFYNGNRTCFELNTDDPFSMTIQLPGAVFYHPIMPGCKGRIPMVAPLPDSQFSASSEWHADYAASRARLNDTNCWTADYERAGEYLQVDFSEPRVVTSIITRGDADYDEWVTSYKVLISNDCTTFTAITDATGPEKIFDGNVDGSSDAENVIEPPVVTRCLRIEVVTWQDVISIRLEAMGCLA